MRRMLMVMLLLAGTSSCMGIKRDSVYGQANGPVISSRATPGLQPTWQGPTGVAANNEATDPPTNATLAQLKEAARVAAASPSPSTEQKARTPYGSSADTHQNMSAYANGQSSGYGNLPPLNTTPPNTIPAPPLMPINQASSQPDGVGDRRLVPIPLPSAMTQTPAMENPQGLQQTTYVDKTFGGSGRLPEKPLPNNYAGQWSPGSSGQAPANPTGSGLQSLGNPSAPPTVNLLESDVGAVAAPIMRVVNSKRITLNFELKDAAGSGVTGVDLFVTRDMRTWKKTEAARPTPNSHVIEVRDEGLYGFLMMARVGSLPAATPKATDLPQVLVNVDTTKPVVQLNGIELSLTPKTPALVIRWNAQDRNFNKRPITISYASAPEGPWVPLAAGIENTGRHEIPLTTSIPHRMLLRIEAVDVAGNLGFAQTREPIRLELPWSTAQVSEEKQLLPPTPDAPRPPPSVQVTTVQGE